MIKPRIVTRTLEGWHREAMYLIWQDPFMVANLFFDGMQEDTDGYDPSVLLTNIDLFADADTMPALFEEMTKITAAQLGLSLEEAIDIWATVAFRLRWDEGSTQTENDGRRYTVDPAGWEIMSYTLLATEEAETVDHSDPDEDVYGSINDNDDELGIFGV